MSADAEDAAQSIADPSARASALTGLVKEAAATDPERAARLIADAERAARSISDEAGKAWP